MTTVPKRLTQLQLAELTHLRERSLFVIDFMSEHSDLGAMAGELRSVVDGACVLQNLKGLRTVMNDLMEMADGMPAKEVRELEQQLLTTLGFDARSERLQNEAKLRSMCKRGNIRNERELRMALAFLERATSGDDLARQLAPLVAQYPEKP